MATITETWNVPDSTTSMNGDLVWNVITGDFDIVSNQAKTAATGRSVAVADTDLGTAQMTVAVQVIQPLDTEYGGGPIASSARTTQDYYYAELHAANDDLLLYRVVGGTATEVGSALNLGLVTGQAYEVTLEVGASGAIRVLLDDVEKITYTDATPLTGQYGGVRAFNSGGTNPVTLDTFSATYDTTAPTVAIDAVHGAGEFVSAHDSSGYDSATETLTITGTASDAVGVSSVEVSIDGGAYAAATNTGTGFSTWSYDLDLTTLALATSHTVDARATDAAGNVGTATRVTFYYSPDGMWLFAGAGVHAAPTEVQVYS